MRIAIALDWEETLAQTISEIDEKGQLQVRYKPRAWLREFLSVLNSEDISFIGIYSWGMITPIGLQHLDQWGFKNWCLDKFIKQVTMNLTEWRHATQDVDIVILVDDLDWMIVNKGKAAQFDHKMIGIRVPNFEEDNTTRALQEASRRIIEAIASCKNT